MITDTTAKKIYTIESGVTEYPIGFNYQYNPDDTPQIKLYKNKHPELPMEYGTDYEISDDGLNVVLLDNYEVGDRLVIMRDIPAVQLSDYHVGRIDPNQLESDFDEAVMRDQSLQAQLDSLAEMPIDHETRIVAIEDKIPEAASSTNQLADKNYVVAAINTKANTLQDKITSEAKLSADLVDDEETTHKFVTAADKTNWNAKQDGLTTAQLDAVNSGVTSTTVSQVAANTSAIANMELSDLTDVTTSSVQDGQFLRYDNFTGKWKNATSSASVGFDGLSGMPRDNAALSAELDSIKTNCVTYIPEDITLQLPYRSPLKLKAGSKITIPNGFEQDGTTLKFDVITIANDITITDDQDRTLFIAVTVDGTALTKCVGSETSSPEAGTYKQYYDSTTNKCYQGTADGYVQTSFPIAIVTSTSAKGIVSIDKLFNGFGYVGKTVFALSGIKVLIPNGRDSNGALKSISKELSQPYVYTATGDGTRLFYISTASKTLDADYAYRYMYSDESNINIFGGGIVTACICGTFIVKIGQTLLFEPKTVYRAVDSNEADFVIASQAPTAGNNYTWYRKYKSGWVEQGIATHTTGGTSRTVSLPVYMRDEYYTITLTQYSTEESSNNNILCYHTPTTFGFKVTSKYGNGTSGLFQWRVEGFASDYSA